MSPNSNCKPQHSELVDRVRQGPRRGACTSRLRRRERTVAAIAAIDIGDTTEETVIVNETTPGGVEETEPAKNGENTEKLVNAIRAAEIYIAT